MVLEGQACIFPYRYLGRLQYDCIRESDSTHYRGEEWCPTSIDAELNPISRGVCKPLILIKQIPKNEIIMYDAFEIPLMVQPTHIPIDIGFFRWECSHFSLPAQGEQYHLVLSSTTNRNMRSASNTFTVLCASYAISVQLKLGAPYPTKKTVRSDLAVYLQIDAGRIQSLNVTGNPIVVDFEIHSQIQTRCPIEVYDALLTLWSTGSNGFLHDVDTSVRPSYRRLDKSDLMPSQEGRVEPTPDYALIVAIVVICVTLCVMIIAAGIYVYRHRMLHHDEHVKTVELHRDWRQARTVSKRVYYFNPTTGETSWSRPLDAAPVEAPNVAIDSEGTYLPPGWNEGDNEGEVFYFHDDGESTSWEFPDWIPHGWTPPVESNNRTSTRGHPGHTRNSTTHVIDQNQHTWVTVEADEGQEYYFNQVTGQSQWGKPHGTSVHENGNNENEMESNAGSDTAVVVDSVAVNFMLNNPMQK